MKLIFLLTVNGTVGWIHSPATRFFRPRNCIFFYSIAGSYRGLAIDIKSLITSDPGYPGNKAKRLNVTLLAIFTLFRLSVLAQAFNLAMIVSKNEIYIYIYFHPQY